MNWNSNQTKILEAFASGATLMKELVEKTGLVRQTIAKHLKDEEFCKAVEIEKAKYIPKIDKNDPIYEAMHKEACKGNVKAADYIRSVEHDRRKAEEAEKRKEDRPSLEETKRGISNMTDGLIRAVRRFYNHKATDQEKQQIRDKHPHWFDGRGKMKKFYTFADDRKLYYEWLNERQ